MQHWNIQKPVVPLEIPRILVEQVFFLKFHPDLVNGEYKNINAKKIDNFFFFFTLTQCIQSIFNLIVFI